MSESVIRRVRIAEKFYLTDRSRRFVLEPIDNWRPNYKAGQYLTMIFRHFEGEKRRSYSFVSSPEIDEPLSVAVKKVDNGEFSRFMIYNSQPGDIFETAGIQGLFTLPADPAGRHYFFLAAGSGIAPCISIIRTLLITTRERITLVYSNTSASDAMFYNELIELSHKHNHRLVIRFLFSDATLLEDGRLSKSLLEKLLNQFIREPGKTMFYLCGPELYMLMITITLRSAGIPDNQIMREDFDTRPRSFLPQPPDVQVHEVRIEINNVATTLKVGYPDTILAAAKKAGITLPYSCEAGRCGACLAKCTAGQIWMAYNEVLTDDDLGRGLILTCQSYPVHGDAAILIET